MFSSKSLAVASAIIAAAGLAFSASAASASTSPNMTSAPHVAPLPFTNNSVGEAGILLADDGHTHYRLIQSDTTAEPLLGTLNDVTLDGASGDEFCDPDTGDAAQDGLFYDASNERYYVGWAYGQFNADAVNDDTDVCASGGLLDTITEGGAGVPTLTPGIPQLPAGFGVAGPNTVIASGLIPVTVRQGDKVLTKLNYTPAGKTHTITFTVSDQTTGWIRNPQIKVRTMEFWEAGAGIFTPTISTNAFNAVEPITESNVYVNFYSSNKAAYPIFTQKAFYGTGGITQVSATNGAATIAPTETSTSSFTMTSSES